jgi:hypothetical protein
MVINYAGPLKAKSELILEQMTKMKSYNNALKESNKIQSEALVLII